jgi:poly(A) polymerase
MAGTPSLSTAWQALLADSRVVELAKAASGVALHLVGGAVRDAGLGRPVDDLDCIVAEEGPAIAQRLAAVTGARLVALGGDRFGALRLVAGERHIDIWDLQGGPLFADLWRRDFTVNAIALSVPDGAIIDPTGGVEDLARRRLRATRTEVFREDPVRVLRLARLATTLAGFDADPATVARARTATPRLSEMPHERLRVELETLFSQSRLSPAAGWCDVLDLPAFFFGKGAVVSGESALTLPTAERLDEWLAARSAESLHPSPKPLSASDSPLALHWTLFTELFSSSRAATAPQLRDLARRGLMTRSCCEAALRLLTPAREAPADEIACRLWLHSAGSSWRHAIALRAVLATSEAAVDGWRGLEAAILSWPASERSRIVSPPALLSGEEVQALLAIPPGPAVGAALAQVRRAQVEGVVRMREEAVALLLARPAAPG